VQTMLDAIYVDEIERWWTGQIKKSMTDFEQRVLASLRPFQSEERLQDLFDAFEVLPKCEEGKYWGRMREDPMLAPSLLVPITRGQYFATKCAGALE